MPPVGRLHTQCFLSLGMKNLALITCCVHSTSQFTKHINSHTWGSSLLPFETWRTNIITLVVQVKKQGPGREVTYLLKVTVRW